MYLKSENYKIFSLKGVKRRVVDFRFINLFKQKFLPVKPKRSIQLRLHKLRRAVEVAPLN